jgi:hypothetical protein
VTTLARIAATNALETDAPTDRRSELKPLAAAVSVSGTTRMISVGIAA